MRQTFLQFHCFISEVILGISNSKDLSAEAADKGGRFIHRGKLGDGDVGGLVHTLPILDLKQRKNQSIKQPLFLNEDKQPEIFLLTVV